LPFVGAGCKLGTVRQTGAPERATAGAVSHVLASKYCDHTPPYRQTQILARHGVELERSTLAGWVGGACWWLEALHERLCKDVLASEHPFCQRHVGAGARSRQRTHEDRATVGLCSRCRAPISENWSPATYCPFDGRFGCVKIGKAAAARGARSRAHETHFTMQFDVSAIDPRCVSAAQAEKNLEWVSKMGQIEQAEKLSRTRTSLREASILLLWRVAAFSHSQDPQRARGAASAGHVQRVSETLEPGENGSPVGAALSVDESSALVMAHITARVWIKCRTYFPSHDGHLTSRILATELFLRGVWSCVTYFSKSCVRCGGLRGNLTS
jgi:hypothetical protein